MHNLSSTRGVGRSADVQAQSDQQRGRVCRQGQEVRVSRQKRGGMSASIRSRVGIFREILADLTGPFGIRGETGLPGAGIINRLGKSLREIRDTRRVPREDMADIVSGPWLE